MDTNRVVNIILTELGLELLKLQESLENTLASTNLDINDKVKMIKGNLREITLNEIMLSKLQASLQNEKEKNNTQEQNTSNG